MLNPDPRNALSQFIFYPFCFILHPFSFVLKFDSLFLLLFLSSSTITILQLNAVGSNLIMKKICACFHCILKYYLCKLSLFVSIIIGSLNHHVRFRMVPLNPLFVIHIVNLMKGYRIPNCFSNL